MVYPKANGLLVFNIIDKLGKERSLAVKRNFIWYKTFKANVSTSCINSSGTESPSLDLSSPPPNTPKPLLAQGKDRLAVFST